MRIVAILPALGLALSGFASDCARISTGLTPLDGLGAGLYRGASGGFYPGGANRPPAAHLAAGLRLAAQVVPRDAAGNPASASGKIVLLSVGMSNTTMEFSAFKSLADGDAEKNPRLVVVDGAQGGWSADRLVAGGAQYWSTVEQRLRAAGVTAAQVQAAWMKQADASPTRAFPDNARQLQGELATLARELRSRFPNLGLLYLSSRIYARYASTKLNPEPHAYESGFAVKWVVEQQIQGDPGLSYENGRAPWMSWGPYLWADGTTARGDGLTWSCAELQTDGTHPGEPARQKVGRMLVDFLETDATARTWFLRGAPAGTTAPVAAAVVNAASWAPGVAPGSIATLWGAGLGSGTGGAPRLPLAFHLQGTSVEIDGVPCLLHYVSPTQINLVTPAGATAGSAVVIRDGISSRPFQFDWRPQAPALFTVSGGTVAALHVDYRPVTAQDPARRGETVALFGTGLGAAPRPVLRIGGRAADVGYAGPVAGVPGLDQINATVPADAPVGQEVEVDLEVGAGMANRVTIPVG